MLAGCMPEGVTKVTVISMRSAHKDASRRSESIASAGNYADDLVSGADITLQPCSTANCAAVAQTSAAAAAVTPASTRFSVEVDRLSSVPRRSIKNSAIVSALRHINCWLRSRFPGGSYRNRKRRSN